MRYKDQIDLIFSNITNSVSIQLFVDVPDFMIIREFIQMIKQELDFYLIEGTRRFLVAVGKIECEEWDLSSFFSWLLLFQCGFVPSPCCEW